MNYLEKGVEKKHLTNFWTSFEIKKQAISSYKNIDYILSC